MSTQELPQWILSEDSPSHGEYVVLLKKDDKDDYPYMTIANYTYRNGGAWKVGNKCITKQVHAYLGPRVLPDFMISGDK